MSYGVLAIEDEVTLGRNIKTYLERRGYQVCVATTGQDGLNLFDSFKPDFVIVDLRLPDISGLDVLKQVHERDPDVRIILMTAHGSVQAAVDAMKAGAYDYLSKPIILSDLKRVLDRAIGEEKRESALTYYHGREAAQGELSAMIGDSAPMRALKKRVHQLLAAEASLTEQNAPAVLVTGETGTGKELVARALHFEGKRRGAPFIELNCAALPQHLVEGELFGHERGAFTDAKDRKLGLVEAAEGGTLLLDEIGEIDLSVQAKMLRLLEDRTVRRLGGLRDRQVNVRIVAATNRDLEQLVQDGAFRSDLYFRLRVLQVAIPPLRERGGDIMLLANHFLVEHSRRYHKAGLRFGASVDELLSRHNWMGNVRELKNTIEQAVLLASTDTIEPADLSLSLRTTAPAHGATAAGATPLELPADGLDIESVERRLVEQALERTGWNVTGAAKLLGLSRDTMRYRIDKFGITRPDQT